MEEQLAGGNAGGAVLVDGTVRRSTGPWTPAVHELLRHLERVGFAGAPRALGYDEQGREVLSYLTGETVGEAKPWPAWVHSDHALRQAGSWLRNSHDVVRDFQPRVDSLWRLARRAWQPGDVIAHNDAAPYNAVWDGETDDLVGFIDWDFAAPQPPVWDLAYLVFSWVPLHARHVVTHEGFTAFEDRARRLQLVLDAYRWTGTIDEVLDGVALRVTGHLDEVHALARTDPLFAKLIDAGVLDELRQALTELESDRAVGAYRL